MLFLCCVARIIIISIAANSDILVELVLSVGEARDLKEIHD